MSIPDEAVEAAARKLFQSTMDEPWEAAYPAQEDHFRGRARGILEAAAPYMLAPAKAEGWRVGYEQGWKDGEESERTGEDYGPHRINPYRSQA